MAIPSRPIRIALAGVLLASCSAMPALDEFVPSFSGTETSATSQQVPALWRDDTLMSVRGTLADVSGDPHKCLLLRRDGEDPVALIGDAEGLPAGARVEVSGPVALWSGCETFRTVRIDRIVALAPP